MSHSLLEDCRSSSDGACRIVGESRAGCERLVEICRHRHDDRQELSEVMDSSCTEVRAQTHLYQCLMCTSMRVEDGYFDEVDAETSNASFVRG